MTSDDVAALLKEIADLLELKGENDFKVRAYRHAANVMESMYIEDMQEFVNSGALKELPGFGKALTEKVKTFVTTGKLPYYDKLVSSIPHGLVEMLRLKGLGPKRIRKIYNELGISSIGELEYACHENRLITIKGFGKQTQKRILKAIELYKENIGRYLLPYAEEHAKNISEILMDIPEVERIEISGSIRRRLEVVRDIDLVVLSSDKELAISEIMKSPHFGFIEERPHSRLVGVLRNRVPIEIWVVEKNGFAAALLLSTGSSAFIGKVLEIARRKRLQLSEEGVFYKRPKVKDPERLNISSEEELFDRLGLAYIVPELRETPEIVEKAKKNRLPNIVNLNEIRGVLHVHSTYSDGNHKIEQLANAAMEMKLQYIGISDHSKSAHYANGLNEERLLKQSEEILSINERLKAKNFKIYRGIEVDILKDGSLDFSDDVLSNLDFVIASIHSHFSMEKEEMTNRIVTALEHRVNVLAHPTGRLLLARRGYKVDMERVLKACAQNGVAIEINSHPQRLDLDWRYGDMVNDLGVFVMINPDAHSVFGLKNIRFGVSVARKAGIRKELIVNTWEPEKLEHWLKYRHLD